MFDRGLGVYTSNGVEYAALQHAVALPQAVRSATYNSSMPSFAPVAFDIEPAVRKCLQLISGQLLNPIKFPRHTTL
jgi:hypothetical protein